MIFNILSITTILLGLFFYFKSIKRKNIGDKGKIDYLKIKLEKIESKVTICKFPYGKYDDNTRGLGYSYCSKHGKDLEGFVSMYHCNNECKNKITMVLYKE